jgi:hypothetical protein
MLDLLLGFFGTLVMMFVFIFIALWHTRKHTLKTADCVEKIWVAHANELRLDPKTGKELPQEKKA